MSTVGAIFKSENIDGKTAEDFLDILNTLKAKEFDIIVNSDVIEGILAIVKKFECEKILNVKVMDFFSKFISNESEERNPFMKSLTSPPSVNKSYCSNVMDTMMEIMKKYPEDSEICGYGCKAIDGILKRNGKCA